MSSTGGIHASAVLRRRVKGEEDHLALGDDDDAAYWAAAPHLYDFSKHEFKQEQEQSPAAPLPSPSQAPAPAPCGGHLCLLALQGTGVGWGVRKRVRYVSPHRAAREADHRDPPPAAAVESAAVVQGDDESSSNGKKRDRPEEEEKEKEAEEGGRDECKVLARTEKKRKRKTGRGRGRGVAKRPKKIRPEERKRNQPEEEEEEEKAEESSQGERKVVMTEKKRKKPEPEAVAEESGQDERKVVVGTETKRTRKTGHGRGRGITERPKKNRREETERERKPAPKDKFEEAGAGAPRAMVDRWTAQRYAAAEASLLGIVRAFGARADQPVQRGELRQEARKHIGDTGLLDHLLKHAANKVLPGSAERLRRRHNTDGAMEYWLEPAELAALRREAGVADPYWVPPPGWKPGDPLAPDACALEVKRQVEELATELAGVKRHMEQLMKAHQCKVSKEMSAEADKAYISYQEKYDCMVKANGNLEKQVLSLEEKYESATRANGKLEVEVLFLKENYEAVLEKNTRLEEQMAALSTSSLSLKDDLLLLNDGGQHMLELEQADLSVKEPVKADKQDGHAGKAPDNAAVGAGDQLEAGDGTASSSGGTGICGKRTSRKCSVRICKPQGTFQWPEPDTALAHPSSPLTPTAEANVASLATMHDELHECMMATSGGLPLPPTPPSASSTNAASTKLPLLPAPASPVQPPPPQAPPSATSPRHPHSGVDLQLRHTGTSAAAALCDATNGLPEGKKTVLDAGAGAGGGGVGTELALATPSY